MKRIFVRGGLPRNIKGSVVAIGVFDGVHRGHQKVIGRAVAEARRLHLPSVVITFYPHPVEVLQPQKNFLYITTLERRLQLIESLGVDVCIVIAFNKEFAAQDPVRFIQDFLVRQLGVRKIVLGSDFQFGRKREGTLDLLKRLGRSSGFIVERVSILNSINTNIKSTFIKNLILEGDLKLLRRFLGRRYDFLGEIEHGEGRGRKLGYRTANFKKENVTILPSGIYFVRAKCVDAGVKTRSKTFFGLCYIGSKPTFKSKNATIILELHLLDLDACLYGQKILMEFFKKERDDIKFSDEKSLVSQIARDVKKARLFFKTSL
ncbi:MAG: bifunctional riboflavin kinase/FAD synthetase [Candidatus Omnitrophica bacterium]|nr:bifunctional riboflavin kinase/FAD synthetase [Candidatus Omnitrophota bacterium]